MLMRSLIVSNIQSLFLSLVLIRSPSCNIQPTITYWGTNIYRTTTKNTQDLKKSTRNIDVLLHEHQLHKKNVINSAKNTRMQGLKHENNPSESPI